MRYLWVVFILSILVAAPACAKEDLAVLPLEALTQQAKSGDAEAEYALALRYAKGQGVEQDYSQALNWYRLAAEHQHPLAQNNLAAMYELGQGVPVDHAKAVHWYREAAEAGQKYAQNSLAIKLFKGEGVAEDRVQAYVYMRLAAEQEYPTAQRNADLIYSALTEEQRAEAQLKLAEIWDRESREALQGGGE